MSRRLGLLLCLVLAAGLAFTGLIEAAYLRNVPVHVRQPDGTVLSLLASGDEFYNRLHDKDGYTIVRNPETGYLVYADKVDGKLVPTPFVAGRVDVILLERAGLKKGLLDDHKPGARVLAVAEGEPVVNAPRTGTINNLVVYIRFSDQEEFAEAFIDNTDGFFNSTESGVNSMRNYYTEASYNQLAISTTSYPGTVPSVYSYQDSFPRVYYMPYDAATNPTGYNGDTERRTREHTLLVNAVNAIGGEVPPGLNIDGDADGRVDNVCFIVKGEPTAWATLLWPHMWSLYTYTVNINGKRVYTYNFQMETTLDVGVLCHEMFHSLGAPDLYHYSQDGLSPVWAWDLMEWDLDPPEHMSAYMKWKYGTWIASIPEITTSGTYTLNSLRSATNNCYKFASPFSSTEYFVVEYRKKTGGGTFEGNLYNEGLLVYRINSAYTGNADGPPDEVYIYRPNGTTTADGEPWYAPFSANQARTQINDSTNPSSFLTDGSPGGISISNVGYYGDTISFDVAFNTITVTSPNGGESWPALGNTTVTWMSTGSFGTVDILLSTDGGTNWATLVDNTSNDGSETVAVPLITSASCFIQVREGAAGVPNDFSDASFSIVVPASPITVTSPNGGQAWAAGSTYDITWTQTGLTGAVTIDLHKGWSYVKTLGTADASAGTFAWAIASDEAGGADYRVRISQGSHWDISDANFSVIVPAALPFDEDFSTPNPGWRQQNIGEGIGSLWIYSATNYAGGSANEVSCSWSNVNPGTTRLITPALITTGRTSLRLMFKHFLDAYGTGCTLKIQTSPDMATWTDEAWSVSATSSNLGPATVETVLTHNLGIPTTYVAFVITGNLYQYDFWYIDDISISGSTPKVDLNGDGQEDILWRYYGEGAYQGLNVAWLLNQSGSPSPVRLATAPTPSADGAALATASSTPVWLGNSRAPKTKGAVRSASVAEAVPTVEKPLVMRGPLDHGNTRPGTDRGRFQASDKARILTRKDAAAPTLLNSGTAQLASLQMTTEVVFSQIADTGWEIAGTGDFNGDRKTDILWRYYGAGAYQGLNDIWYLDGTAFVGESVFSQVADTNWRIAGTGDFNGDAKTDILWRYYGTGTYQGLNVIWFMNGDQKAGETVFSQVLDTDWRIEGTGDFNGDGQTDILWRYYGTGDYQGLNDIWFMNGTTFVGESVFSQIMDTAWQIGGTGDFNGDGQTDILWRYYGQGPYQGLNDIWYMNGTQFVSEEVFSQIPDTNWRIVNR